jgi:hypothetical protein
VTYRNGGEVFDFPEFWFDVKDYCKRNEISHTELSDLINVNTHDFQQKFKFETHLSLLITVSLAKVCDLSLDMYIK